LVHYATLAIQGGASVLQYRSKTGDREQRRREALALSEVCRAFQVPFIVNDDAELARAVSASGIHLGRDDLALAEARRILGEDCVIGVSCYNSLARARAAQAAGADYVAFGSFFPSPTKPDAVRADIDLLRHARGQLHIPMVAIGGITVENADTLLAAGADALAVIHGVFGQPDVQAAAAQYAALFQGHSSPARGGRD
jgi:thiamine-phosphate pyrophosphorylase